MQEALSYDDVLLIPRYSDIESRAFIDLSSGFNNSIYLDMPVISSPMDTVTEDAMALAMHKAGGLGVIHRYNTVQEQASTIAKVLFADENALVGAAIGMTGYLERVYAALSVGARIICVDVAHGHHILMERCLKALKDKYSDEIHIMAGNVATLEAFDALASWGADSIRVGIGGGSICSTRLVTGHGVPTFQSILDCARTTYNEVKIIADGGMKTTGDMVKALAAGADFVMVGSMLAGTKESPDEVFQANTGKKYKVYRGMASADAQQAWRGKYSAPEGISTTIPFRGGVEHILQNISGGLRSGFSYTGARNLRELRSKACFSRQTSAGQVESSTHITSRS